MGTKFSELPANEPITGAEIVCLSQDVAAVLTSVQATVDEVGAFFSSDSTFVTDIVNNATFVTEVVTELTTNATFVTELTSNSSFISEVNTFVEENVVLRTTVETSAATSYTLVLADAAHKWKQFTAATDVTITIPPQSSVAFPDYTYIEFEQAGNGAVIFVADVGVTLNYNENLTNVTNGNFAVVALKRTALNTWNLFGNLVPA